MHCSVITASYNRPQALANTCLSFRQQHIAGFKAEHIVCHDGPSSLARTIAESFGASYFQCPRERNTRGAAPRNFVTPHARGSYLIFWDDDNSYEPHAVSSLLSCAWGHDVGICTVRGLNRGGQKRMPSKEQIVLHDVDTACICVKAETARLVSWDESRAEFNDFAFLTDLLKVKPDLDISYSPVIVATHVPRKLAEE